MKPLTSEALREAGLLLFGPKRGWQSRLAESLGVDRASVTRYLAGGIVPGPVSAAVRSWLEIYELTGKKPRTQTDPDEPSWIAQ